MVRKRIDTVITHMDKRRKNAETARAALKIKRERAVKEWTPPPVPPGFPPRPDSLVDYVTDYTNPATGVAFGNYAALGRALGISRATVHEWKVTDHIPDKYIMAIVMLTGINAATLMLWNTLYIGRPRALIPNK